MLSNTNRRHLTDKTGLDVNICKVKYAALTCHAGTLMTPGHRRRVSAGWYQDLSANPWVLQPLNHRRLTPPFHEDELLGWA